MFGGFLLYFTSLLSSISELFIWAISLDENSYFLFLSLKFESEPKSLLEGLIDCPNTKENSDCLSLFSIFSNWNSLKTISCYWCFISLIFCIIAYSSSFDVGYDDSGVKFNFFYWGIGSSTKLSISFLNSFEFFINAWPCIRFLFSPLPS